MNKVKFIVYFLMLLSLVFLGEWLSSLNINEKIIQSPESKSPVSPDPFDKTYIFTDVFDNKRSSSVSEDNDLAFDLPELELKDFIWNFLGFIKSQQYDLAVHFFDAEILTDYFYTDYQKLDDYLSKVEYFGERISREGQLTSFGIESEQPESDNLERVNIRMYYTDDREVLLNLRLRLDNDDHEGHHQYVIVSPIAEILNQFESTPNQDG